MLISKPRNLNAMMSKKGEKAQDLWIGKFRGRSREVETKKSHPICWIKNKEEQKKAKASFSLKLSRKSSTSTLINETQC